MKKRTWMVFFIFCSVLLFLFTSCVTKETEFVEVGVPTLIYIDIDKLTEPVLNQRPDNSLLKVNVGPVLNLEDVVENSAVYLYAWNMWQNYAEALEKTIDVIASRLKEEQNL